MADDLQNYKLQLQQVEAALMTDPNNEELLKLKLDLEEVIELTRDLIKTQLEESVKPPKVVPSSSNNIYDDDDVTASLLAAEGHLLNSNSKKWSIGDKCTAKWSEDGQFYGATIEGITDSGEVNVVFDAYQNRETTTLADIKEPVAGNKRGLTDEENDQAHKKGRANQREYLKKKKQKKQLRYKEIEAEREVEKNKWLAFSTKSSKKVGGLKTKSIFASPDNVNGRVGIGTCGMSGKPMTEFTHGEKRKKGA